MNLTKSEKKRNNQRSNRRSPRKTEESPGFGNKKLEGPDRPST
jgi:hypothetical protein